MHLQPQNRVAHFVRLALKGGVVATCLAFGSAAQAGIAFQFNFSGAFTDGANNDAAQQGAMVTAGNLFSNMFGNYFSNSGTIVLNASGSDDPLSNTLASASSAVVDSGAAGLVGSVVRDKLLTGIDKNGATADGSVDVNFGAAWQLDPNALVLGSEFDFYAAVFHELTHALGFASTIDPVPGGNPYFPNQWSAYDTFLRDKNGNVIIDAGFNLNQVIFDTASDGGTGNGVYFDGANAVAANGGNPVALYSPTTFDQGSSVSHLDKNVFPSDMMKHDRDFGPQEARDYSLVEVGILTDLGYTRTVANSVPEPASLALVLAGVGGLLARRRKA